MSKNSVNVGATRNAVIPLDYIKDLSSWCLNDKDTFKTKSTTMFKCDCSFLALHNRVIIDNNFDLTDLNHAKEYHKNNPFTLWVNSQNLEAKNKLDAAGFSLQISWPTMMLELKNLPPISCDSHITIKQLTDDEEILTTWVPLIIKSYNPQFTPSEFEKAYNDWHIFFNYLRNSTTYPQMNFFIWYWENIPAATRLFIVKNDTVFLHLNGVLPEYRRRGIGSTITSMPLHFFKKNGIKKALNFASAMGKPLYEKLGFKVFGQIDTYKTEDLNK
ncbi:TPA: hypothetical protein DEO28_01650 [Candidatus Dependentiae bacterium]|nr:MAG: Acetyltransferase [candidate division TM6 bacterium GW2011_GWE2_31_21]KKP52936.1 MAG: Acetyltransferase [candidate division TM6 bacterium GW2011_GWF2_33_332]HBS47823.1 hypothetical protein [Candidatus Dependentiae bacterium]HBZ73201.1 hypothetical protein [Candidatus Dependentiae bacterium]